MDPVTMLSKHVSQSRMTGNPSVGTWNLEQAAGKPVFRQAYSLWGK